MKKLEFLKTFQKSKKILNFQRSWKILNLKSVKKILKTVGSWFFIQVVGIGFFPCSLPSGSKKSILLRTYFYWNKVVLWSRDFEGIFPEALLVTKFLYIATHFSPKIQDPNLSSMSRSKMFYILKSSTLKNLLFCVSRQNHISLKVPKTAIIIDICRYSNGIFSASTSLIHQKNSIGRSLSCTGGIDWKAIDNFPSIIILIDQIVQNAFIKNDSSGLSKHWFFSAIIVLISFMRAELATILWKIIDPFSSHLVFCSFYSVLIDLVCHRVLPEATRQNLIWR